MENYIIIEKRIGNKTIINIIDKNYNYDDYYEENDYETILLETLFTIVAGYNKEYIINNGIYLQTMYCDKTFLQKGYVITPNNKIYKVKNDIYNKFIMEYLPNYKIIFEKNQPKNIDVITKQSKLYSYETELNSYNFWIKHRDYLKEIKQLIREQRTE